MQDEHHSVSDDHKGVQVIPSYFLEKCEAMKDKRKLLKLIGFVLMVCALIFIIRKIITYDIDYSVLLDPNNLGAFLLVMLGVTGATLMLHYPWFGMSRMFTSSKDVRYADALQIYYKANLFKYVPGNVFQYIGRNELAIRAKKSHADIFAATLAETVIIVASSIVIALVGLQQYFFDWINNLVQANFTIWLIIILAMVGIVVGLLIFFRKKTVALMRRYRETLNKANVAKLIAVFGYYVVYNLLCGLLYLAVYNQIAVVPVTPEMYGIVLGAFVAATTAGFVTLGAPGGIGIREATITLLLGNVLPQGDVLLAIIIYRFLNIFGDILSFLLATAVFKLLNRKTKCASVQS